MVTQTNWRIWHLPWHTAKFDSDYGFYQHFAGVGPFQYHWFSYRKGLIRER